MRIGALARVYLSPEPDIWRPRCLYIHLARVSLYLVRERCAPSWQFQSRGRRTGARSQLLGPRYLDSRYILRFSLKSSQPGSLSLSLGGVRVVVLVASPSSRYAFYSWAPAPSPSIPARVHDSLGHTSRARRRNKSRKVVRLWEKRIYKGKIGTWRECL